MKLEAEHTIPGYYNASGKRIPSVTTISKLIQSSEALIGWAWNLGMQGIDYRAVRDQAATAGHIAHSMIECAITGRTFTVDPALDEETVRLAKQGFSAFQSWMLNTQFKLLHSEVRVISERYQFGGRLDCIGEVTGFDKEGEIIRERCIVDWKTSGSRRPQESWLPQIAAYRQAWNETHRNDPVEACHLMVLAKADAGFSHHYFPSSSMDIGWRAFLACLALYDCKKEVGMVL